MVNEEKKIQTCAQCPEKLGDVQNGTVYCCFLNCQVAAGSLMCPHGEFLTECF